MSTENRYDPICQSLEDIKARLCPEQKPLQARQIERLSAVQTAFLELAKVMQAECFNTTEKRKAFELLIEAKTFADQSIRRGQGILDLARLSELMHEVELRDVRVVRMWLHTTDFANLRKYSLGHMEIQNQLVLLKLGMVGDIWGIQVWTSRCIPAGYAVLIGEDEGDVDREDGWVPREDQLQGI